MKLGQIYRQLYEWGRQTHNDDGTCDGCGDWFRVDDLEVLEPDETELPEEIYLCPGCLEDLDRT